MRIKKLILQNIGVYRNRNEFDLQSERPLVLIAGMNGRGKTTFLNAVLLAFYGKYSGELIQYNERFEGYLEKLGNKSGESTECFVEIHFCMHEPEEAEYHVRRSWNLSDKKLQFQTRVEKNGQLDTTLSQNWDMFVEELLPRAAAGFFFFDGEKIAKLAASAQDERLRSSILSLLGVDIVVQLIADLQRVSDMEQKLLSQVHYEEELQELEEHREECLQSLAESKKKRKETLVLLEESKRKLEELDSEYTRLGGCYAEQRTRFKEEQAKLIVQRESIQTQLLDLAASSFPLSLNRSLLKDILEKARNEKEQSDLRAFVEQFPKLYQSYTGQKDLNQEMQGFYTFASERIETQPLLYQLDSESILQLSELEKILSHEKLTVCKLLKKKANIEGELKKLENYLAVKVDNEKISEILEEINRTTLWKSELEREEAKLHEDCDFYEAKLTGFERQKKQILKKVVEEQESMDEHTRVVAYAQKQIEILKDFQERLQRMKVNKLAAQITECFSRLSAKDGLIQKVAIEPVKLEFHYYNKYGKKVERTTLSSGENQLLVIAMLWALGICSKSEFPLIIDTPLARLDSTHRASLMHNYFPKASEQVIILSTDKEITEQDYKEMKPYVGKEFSLVYDEETMSSTVHSGYFGGN